jgi:prepilin-type N-terminal cleavage/methylation domain-containing protein
MLGLRARRTGFTLVELLVVIAIITVLVAILLPVYQTVRERVRVQSCMANLRELALSMRIYRMDMGYYPGPYDPATGEGGLNALYPNYVTNRGALLCPDDTIASGQDYIDRKLKVDREWEDGELVGRVITYEQLLGWADTMYLWEDPDFFTEHYSSYNDLYNWVGYVGVEDIYSLCDIANELLLPGENLAYWYMWYRWDPGDKLGVLSNVETFRFIDRHLHHHLAQQVYWAYYSPWNPEQGERLADSMQRPLWDPGNPEPSAYDYMPYGMPSASFPGLINRNAPDSTIITRCSKHRKMDRDGRPVAGTKDIVVRLDASCAMVPGLEYDWTTQPFR